MDIIKTKNVNLILYSIVRQLVKGDTFTYIIQDEDEVTITLNKRKEKSNFILVMEGIASIKRALKEEKHVVIKTANQVCCGISKCEDYYYIDNADKMLIHVVFELILGNTEIGIILNEGETLRNIVGYTFGLHCNMKSQFFNDCTASKEFYNLTESITNNVLKYVNENKFITLITKRESFTFTIII